MPLPTYALAQAAAPHGAAEPAGWRGSNYLVAPPAPQPAPTLTVQASSTRRGVARHRCATHTASAATLRLVRSLALDGAVDVPHEREARAPSDSAQHQEEAKAHHCHVAEEERRLQAASDEAGGSTGHAQPDAWPPGAGPCLAFRGPIATGCNLQRRQTDRTAPAPVPPQPASAHQRRPPA